MRDIFSARSEAGTHEQNALSRSRERLAREGRTLKELSQSNPTMVGLGRDPLLFKLDCTENELYTPEPRGLRSARSALSAHYAALRRSIDAENLFLCASTSEAYSWLFKLLCDPGDAVLIPKPGYPLFEHLAALEHVRTLAYTLEYAHASGWHIDIESIAASLAGPEGARVKALIVINPNNPTGSYVRRAERARLLDLCEQYGLALISDEVFFDFPMEEAVERESFAGERRALTFVLDGLSKRLGMPQMKLGWIALSGPDAGVSAARRRLELIADTFLSAGTPIMNALPGLLARESEFLSQMLPRIRANYAQYREILEGYEGSPHRVLVCQGGWTALIESPAYLDEERVALALLETTGISALPGYFFDFERGVHFAFSLIIPENEARSWCAEYRGFFDSLRME
jgi:aspartate/methionine/tyrosine aminotransferase